jgi:hypothetical protein
MEKDSSMTYVGKKVQGIDFTAVVGGCDDQMTLGSGKQIGMGRYAVSRTFLGRHARTAVLV